jgi:hypothetical protein
MAMPAVFRIDGVPISLALLAGEWQETKLLTYAYAWEQSAKPRKSPFSTPPLVKGVAPAPMSLELGIAGGQTNPAPSPTYRVKFTYDRTTGELRYDASASGLAATDRVLGLTIHRTEGDKPGPIIAHLLAPNQVSGTGVLLMRGRNREDLTGGKLYVYFYTRQQPLGIGRSQLAFR